jgi:general secretion pathway protein D
MKSTPTQFRLSALALTLALASCSAQRVRDEASTQMREGRFEAAIDVLAQGVSEHPDSLMLRSALLNTKAEALARWVAEATQLRSAGKFELALQVLARAQGADARNERIANLRLELLSDIRVQRLLETATAQSAAGRKDAAIQTLDTALRESPRHPTAVTLRRQLEADLRMESGGGRPRLAETRPVSLDFRGAPLSTVLEALTRGSGINFILDRDVKQDARTTLFLRSASLEDALDLVTGANQLARRIVDPQTVLVYPNTPDKHKEHQEQVVRVFHLANADAKATAQLLRSMLRLKDPFVDERTNMVAIRETPEIVAMAERLVALHDSGDSEVMLEVEILEVKTSRLTELGISVPNGLTLTPLAAAGGIGAQAAGGGALTVNSIRGINSDRIGISLGNVALNLRREVGDFNILANPRIRTKNREKARVVIGDRFPVVTSTTNATGFVSESVNYLDVGLKLDVEPIVSLDDDVTIKLSLEVSALAGSVRTAGGSLAYQVGTRNANTTLRLRDGETQVLAGLISNDDRTSANRIPGLGDLPIAGRLFSNQKDEYQRTELMLAITPRVIRSTARPDISQAELWVGTENAPRLRGPSKPVASVTAPAPAPSGGPPRGTPSSPVAAPSLPNAQIPADAPPGVAPLAPAQLVWRGPVALKAGEVHTIPIHLVSPTAVRGAMVDLKYTAQNLEVLEITEGRFFRQGGGTTNFTQSIDAAAGRVTVGILRGDASGASGDAPMFEMRVRVKSAGTADVGVSSLRPIGVGGVAQPGAQASFRITAQ